MASTTISTEKPARRRGRVLIIGAGASGLQAACSLLTQHGHEDFVILEARDRVGGRIYTWYPAAHHVCAGFPDHVDLGAAWVHGTEDLAGVSNPMMRYFHRQQDLVEIMPGCGWMRPGTVLHRGLRGGDDVVGENNKGGGEQAPKRLLYLFHENGQRLDRDEAVVQKALARHFDIIKRRVPYKARTLLEQGLGLQTAHTSLQETLDEIDKEIARDSDQRVNLLSRFYMHLVTTWYGKSASQLQLANFVNHEEGEQAVASVADWMYEEEGDFCGPHCLPRSGMQSLLQPMLDKVRDKIVLEQDICELWQEGGCIFVKTKSGNVFEGEACIVTLPVNCLKEDTAQLFSRTEISEEKKEAIQYLSMGKYKKVLLLFDRIFWPVDPPLIGLVREENGSALGDCLVIDNLWAKDGLACFEAILVGDAAEWATNRPDGEIQREVLDFVQVAFRIDPTDLLSWCRDCHVSRWEEDAYSRGAYASLSLGALPRHVEAMLVPEWDGALMFAGDATVDGFEGSVHAALLSGESAANKIHEFLSSTTIS